MPVPEGPLAVFKELHDLLDSVRVVHATIGGWAAIAWGSVRTTKDVDFLVDAPKPARPRLEAALRGSGFTIEWRPGGEDDPIPLLLRLGKSTPLGRIPADCIVAVHPADLSALERRVTVSLGEWSAPVLRPEDLIAMKLAAGSPLDLEDARAVYASTRPSLDIPLLESSCRARKVLSLLKKLHP